LVHYLVLKLKKLFQKQRTFHIQNILNNGQLTVIPKTSARINDFWITYTKNEQFHNFILIFQYLDNQGNEKNRKTISVNYPLIDK
jgi:cytochrome c biogenesis protein ResB